jgi:hypothetical protein
MARPQNTVSTTKIHLATTPEVCRALDALVATGKFGKTRSEVAEELMRLKLREVELEGWLGHDAPGRRRASRRRARGPMRDEA